MASMPALKTVCALRKQYLQLCEIVLTCRDGFDVLNHQVSKARAERKKACALELIEQHINLYQKLLTNQLRLLHD